MIHYDKILNMAVQIIEELWKEERKTLEMLIERKETLYNNIIEEITVKGKENGKSE